MITILKNYWNIVLCRTDAIHFGDTGRMAQALMVSYMFNSVITNNKMIF